MWIKPRVKKSYKGLRSGLQQNELYDSLTRIFFKSEGIEPLNCLSRSNIFLALANALNIEQQKSPFFKVHNDNVCFIQNRDQRYFGD